MDLWIIGKTIGHSDIIAKVRFSTGIITSKKLRGLVILKLKLNSQMTEREVQHDEKDFPRSKEKINNRNPIEN